MGVTVVNDDRNIQIFCQGKLLFKDLFLDVARSIIVIIVVQSDFAQSHCLFIGKLLCNGIQIFSGILCSDLFRLIGMDTDTAIDKWILFGKFDACKISVSSVANIHNGTHSMGSHRGKQGIAIFIKTRVIVMCVRVKNILHEYLLKEQNRSFLSNFCTQKFAGLQGRRPCNTKQK